ncbi:MAG: hypothetical protein IPL52_16040 [Flavobacteriales bacterium]|nr:hypothetical protein [Flavobacteriales bacterium]
MRSNRIILLLLGLVIGLASCITIEENYTFSKNGSGTMTYVVDMSEMGNMLASLGGDEKKDGGGDEMGNLDMSEHAAALKSIAGIAKVKMDKRQKWVQKLSFSFTDVGALNRALNQLMPDSTGTSHEFFKWEGGTLVRTSNRYAYDISSTMANEADDDDGGEGDESGFDMNSMLSSMKYKYSFKFKKPVASTENGAMTREEGSTKEVKLSTDWSVLAKDPKALDVRISLAQ